MRNLYNTLKPIVFGRISSAAGNVANFHSHQSIELHYILKGSTSFKYMHQGNENFISVEENQLCILFPNTSHQESFPVDCDYLLLELECQENLTNLMQMLEDFARVNDLPIKQLLSPNNTILTFPNATTCKKTFLNLIDTLYLHLNQNTDDFFALRYELLIKQLFLNICEMPLNERAFSKTNLHLNRAISFIKKNYQASISITDIARHVNISEGYMNRLFKSELNVTPAAYLSDYRLHKAAVLLKQSPLSISQIYTTVGFRNIRTFEIAFLAKYNISPNEYRKSSSIPRFAFETDYKDNSITHLWKIQNDS